MKDLYGNMFDMVWSVIISPPVPPNIGEPLVHHPENVKPWVLVAQFDRRVTSKSYSIFLCSCADGGTSRCQSSIPILAGKMENRDLFGGGRQEGLTTMGSAEG